MTRSEQHKLIQELKLYSVKMSRDDLQKFEMMLKRDKDDEDLDELSLRDLKTLHSSYVRKQSKKDVEELWKKMTGGKS